MPATRPLVVHATDHELDGLDDAVKGRVDFRTLFSGDSTPTAELTAGIAQMEPGGYLGLHRHAPAEIYYVLRGSGLATLDGVEHEVNTGCAVFIPGNTEHGIRNPGPDPLHVLYAFAVDRFDSIEYHYSQED